MLGFIGAGSMGGAIVRGIVAAELYPVIEIFVCGSTPERSMELASELGVASADCPRSVVEAAGPGGIVILAVKPYLITEILDSCRDVAGKLGTVFVSIAAGVQIAAMASHLEAGQPIIRTMPNVAASIRQSMTALCLGPSVPSHQGAAVERIFAAIGKVAHVEEKDFAIFSAIAGCSPAYTFEYIDALARAGVRNGLPKNEAAKIAAQAVLGSAQLALAGLEEGTTPATLADSVQSPGGTTVAGIVELEAAGFGAAVVRGVQASVDRDRELQD